MVGYKIAIQLQMHDQTGRLPQLYGKAFQKISEEYMQYRCLTVYYSLIDPYLTKIKDFLGIRYQPCKK